MPGGSFTGGWFFSGGGRRSAADPAGESVRTLLPSLDLRDCKSLLLSGFLRRGLPPEDLQNERCSSLGCPALDLLGNFFCHRSVSFPSR
jgi:hypothetical protein